MGEWPFDDVPNLGVFVTHEVWRQGKPILWVVHDRDGDWAFGGEGDLEVDTMPCPWQALTRRLLLSW